MDIYFDTVIVVNLVTRWMQVEAHRVGSQIDGMLAVVSECIAFVFVVDLFLIGRHCFHDGV